MDRPFDWPRCRGLLTGRAVDFVIPADMLMVDFPYQSRRPSMKPNAKNKDQNRDPANSLADSISREFVLGLILAGGILGVVLMLADFYVK